MGFWIITVPLDSRSQLDALLAALDPVLKSFGADVIPQDRRPEDHIDGSQQIVQIVGFPDVQTAHACLESKGYAMTAPLREDFETFHLVVIEQGNL